MSPLGIENQDPKYLHSSEWYLMLLVKYAQIGLKWSLTKVNRDHYSLENFTTSPLMWDVPRGTSH